MKKDIFFSPLELLSSSCRHCYTNCGELPSGLGKMLTLPALLIADSGVQQYPNLHAARRNVDCNDKGQLCPFESDSRENYY